MNYLSTRGGAAGISAARAIRLGIAPDGGLFTPETIPQVSTEQLQNWLQLDYAGQAVAVLSLFLTDYDHAKLAQMVHSAYACPAKFDDPAVTPIREFGEGQYALELWHGPTCAFKDVALQLLPYLMTEAGHIEKDSNEIVILVATSGDTGKAALEGFKDVPGTRILVFYPEQGVSQIQYLQMVTQEGENTAVAGIEGNFDDAQNGVKRIFTDPELAKRLSAKGMAFSSANSINWGRLAPQIVYYFYGYLELCRRGKLALGAELNVNVPTGNFGNILAAYFAKRMGLPIGKLICSSNANNVLTEFINTGHYNRNRPFYTTMSPSMDILISSNLERLLYYLAKNDASVVCEWMDELKESGRYQIGPEATGLMREWFFGGFAGEEETSAAIKRVYEGTGYLLDTHTAVGQAVYEKYQSATGDERPVLLAATASPFKFNASVMKAIGGVAAVSGRSEFELLNELSRKTDLPIPAGLRGLDQKPVRHQTVCGKAEMAAVVERMLGL
jgi:threonine synthase